MTKALRLARLLATLVVVGACSPTPSASPDATDGVVIGMLPGTAWTAVRIGGAAALPVHEPSIEFDPAGVDVRGSTGCNDWAGRPLSTPEGHFNILEISTTKRACDENVARQELAFLTILRSTRSLLIRDGLLVLGGVDGEIVFRPGVGLGGTLERA